jgi:hypothetical protein
LVRKLAVGLSWRRHGFYPKSVRVRILVDSVAQGKVLLDNVAQGQILVDSVAQGQIFLQVLPFSL